jgi:protein FRG1
LLVYLPDAYPRTVVRQLPNLSKMSLPVHSKRLKFKGEKTKKKRRREDGGEAGEGSKRRKEDNMDPETWVLPDDPSQIRGPTFIVHPSDPSPICVNYDSTRRRIILHVLDKEATEDGTEPPSLLERTPTDTSQVWVITRVAGSSTINLRTGTGDGKFLSCDAHGLVSADRDARGPQEEWTPVILSDGMVAFMNVYEKYLSVDEVAGGSLQLRGDSEEVGFGERFWVKVQSKYKREANDEEKKKKEGQSDPIKIDESSTNRIYQAWGAGRSVTSAADKAELKAARKEGRLAEAMLDRRAKLKSDRFC